MIESVQLSWARVWETHNLDRMNPPTGILSCNWKRSAFPMWLSRRQECSAIFIETQAFWMYCSAKGFWSYLFNSYNWNCIIVEVDGELNQSCKKEIKGNPTISTKSGKLNEMWSNTGFESKCRPRPEAAGHTAAAAVDSRASRSMETLNSTHVSDDNVNQSTQFTPWVFIPRLRFYSTVVGCVVLGCASKRTDGTFYN